jgi:hypothetical protein
VAEYTGSRRAIEPMSPALAASVFAEDDAALTCPECGAGVRVGQEWCTLCMHVLRKPEPEPEPVIAPSAPQTVVAAPAQSSESSRHSDAAADVASVAPSDGSSEEVRAHVEAAAQALLAQLAVESSRDRVSVPEYLNSKARIAVFVAVVMVVLCALGLGTLGVLGSLFG